MNAYDNLRNAIVRQAAEDYAAAFMGNTVGDKDADCMVRECEDFFHSEWYVALTNGKVDGEWLAKQIKIRELKKAADAYDAILNLCNRTMLKAAVRFPKVKNEAAPKPMTYIFPPRFAEKLMDFLRIQRESIKMEIRELKNEEADA